LAQSSSRNFLFSISDEFNPFDVTLHNYILTPGHMYTFRVLANQYASTSELKQMGIKERGCRQHHESDGLVF